MSQTTRRPGEVLRDDFMAPLGLSANALAMALHVPSKRITDIIAHDDPQPITPETALLLANYFGTMTDFWINLQTAYDLSLGGAGSLGASHRSRRPEAMSRLQEL